MEDMSPGRGMAIVRVTIAVLLLPDRDIRILELH
jgi:hypothetical protein